MIVTVYSSIVSGSVDGVISAIVLNTKISTHGNSRPIALSPFVFRRKNIKTAWNFYVDNKLEAEKQFKLQSHNKREDRIFEAGVINFVLENS